MSTMIMIIAEPHESDISENNIEMPSSPEKGAAGLKSASMDHY